jgi:single-strand DNA-binding protein
LKVCNFSIATNCYYKREGSTEFEKETSFFDVQVWGRLAEKSYAKGKKGRGVRVVGRLKQDRWQQDGKPRSKVYIVAEHVEFRPEFKKDNEPETTATTEGVDF